MRSACWYYRSKGMIILRSLANIDDWDAELKKVTDAENALQKDITQFTGEDMRKNLEGLLAEAKIISFGMREFEQMFSDLMYSQKKDDTAKYLRDLFLIDPRQSMKDLEQKKGGLLTSASDWILDTREYAALTDWHDDSGQLVWIKGPPGTGKTMLLISIIKTLLGQFSDISPRVAYFFFQGTGDTSTNATAAAALRSLVWMILVQQPELTEHLESAIKWKGLAMFTGEQTLQSLLELFKDVLKDPRFLPTYIIVDALDECLKDLKHIQEFILDSSSITNKVRWLVSSRPIVELGMSVPKLLEIDAEELDFPVKIFVEYKLSKLKDLDGYNKDILADLSVEMQKRAGNTFLWVALVFIELMEKGENLQRPLGSDALEIVKQTPRELNELYSHMMNKIERSRSQDQQRSKDILSAMVLVQRPLDLFELDILAGLYTDKDVTTIETMVKRCGSYLIVADHKVSFIHQSAKDYLQDCYQTRIQPDGMGRGHGDLVSRSIKAMGQGLSQNPYRLSYDTEARYLVVPEPDPLASYKYSSVFWMDHLGCQIREAISSRKELDDNSEVLVFLKNHFLVWLESMSLLGEISYGLASIRNLLNVIPRQPPNNNRWVPDRIFQAQFGLLEILEDFERFVSRNLSVIAIFPRQIYGSALLFSPKTSKVRGFQWGKRPNFIEDVSGIMKTWGPCRFVLDDSENVSTSSFYSVVFSPDGKLFTKIPSTSNIRLYDTATGTPTRILTSDNITTSVSFSPNGELLTGHREDNSLRLWAIETGECNRVLHHEDRPSIAKFSPSGRIFSSYSRSTIKIWDTSTAAVRQVLQIPKQDFLDEISQDLTFSPDDRLLVALTKGCRICVWDTSSGELVDMVGNERDSEIIKFWPDGKILARSRERAEIWELENDRLKMLVSHEQEDNCLSSGQTLSQFIAAQSSSNGHGFQQGLASAPRAVLKHFHTSALCSHGRYLATVEPSSENWPNEVLLWDVSEGRLVQSLRGHSSFITDVTFSPEGHALVSSSENGQVILWDILVAASENSPEDQCKQPDYVQAIAFSHNGQLVATVTEAQDQHQDTSISIGLWDTQSSSPIRTLKDSRRALPRVLTIAFDPLDTMLISVHYEEIMFWDCATGEIQHVLKYLELEHTNSVLFSPDGKHFVTRHRLMDDKVRCFNTTTRASNWMNALPYSIWAWGFSPDSKLLAVSSSQKVEVWDVETGTLQGVVDGLATKRGDAHESPIHGVAVSSGGEAVACRRFKRDKTIQLWNVRDGTLTHEFEVEYKVRELSFSADSHYINAGPGRICPDSTHKDCNQIPSGFASVILPESGVLRELGDWIVMDWRKVIRLPLDRTATAAAFSHGCLALGHEYGNVIIVKLKEDLDSTDLQ